jgi:hypothetical protein
LIEPSTTNRIKIHGREAVGLEWRIADQLEVGLGRTVQMDV